MTKPQLFLLHFAGGNCYSYNFLEPFLGSFQVVALELPGRGRRMHEPLLKDFDVAADDLHRQLLGKRNDSNYLIYGHSMGAYLALRVCQLLDPTIKQPSHLIVSGNAGPGVSIDGHVIRHALPHVEFKESLKALGGIPEALLEDKEAFAFYEPILRADFELIEVNQLVSDVRINCPLLALMGAKEQNAKKIENWGRFTRSTFQFDTLEGDHFFIHHHGERLAEIFRKCLTHTTASLPSK